MKILLTLLFLLMASPLLAGDSNVRVEAAPTAENYLVHFRPGSLRINGRKVGIEELVQHFNGAVEKNWQVYFPAAKIRIPAAAANGLSRAPGVISLEKDRLAYPSTTDPFWGRDRINQRQHPLDENIDFQFTGNGADIFIVDTGVDPHPDFGNRLSNHFFDADPGGDGIDCSGLQGHGTKVASVAAGDRYGLARYATIYNVKVFRDAACSLAYYSDIADGIAWIMSRAGYSGVANFSLSGPSNSSTLSAMIDDLATRYRILPVVTAGNDGQKSDGSELACNRTFGLASQEITVANSMLTDGADYRASSSGYGDCVHLFSPGTRIGSARKIDGIKWYSSFSGTSAAAPMIAGYAAALLQVDPYMQPHELKSIVLQYATQNAVNDARTPGARMLYTFDGSN